MLLSDYLRSFRRQRGYASLPGGIDLLLTDACDLRCSYCPIWGDAAPARSSPVLMDTAAALRFIAGVAPFRPMIRLIGGEPLMHPDWPTVVSAIRDRGLYCTAVSNGTRLEREAERLVRSGLYAIGISLDTTTAANNAARGGATWETVARGVEALAAAKRRLGSPTPLLEIYTTVHEGSYAELSRWAEELRGWDIHLLRIQHLVWFSSSQLARSMDLLSRNLPGSEPRFFGQEEQTYTRDVLPAIDLAVLVDQLRKLKEGSFPFRIDLHPDLSLDDMAHYYGDPGFRRHDRLDCSTMEHYAFVDPRGRLYPCLTLDMGNVFDDPFPELWNGPRLRAFRRLIRREQRMPMCHRCPD